MTDIDTSKLSWDEWDELQNPPPDETDFLREFRIYSRKIREL